MPLDDAKVRTEFGVVDRLAALDAFHSMPEYSSKWHPYFQNIVWTDGKVDVLDNLFRGMTGESEAAELVRERKTPPVSGSGKTPGADQARRLTSSTEADWGGRSLGGPGHGVALPAARGGWALSGFTNVVYSEE